MQSIIIWSISFWMFSSTVFLPGQATFQSRWFYFFQVPADLTIQEGVSRKSLSTTSTYRTRFIEITDTGLEEKRATMIVERVSPLGQAVRFLQTRPVFRAFMGDVDMNGEYELILGITKTVQGEKFRRVYVYKEAGDIFQPKWLGSRLSFRLLDFSLTRISGRTGLESIERHSGKLYKGKYLWDSFGFRTVSLIQK